ncbi:MAG: diacylglycerol kinase family lipid kinase [Streptosporangiaceae bacterium]|nr:diacylglycerol kinase family lipid kinase [Streptosporangiaceae bacterium]
MPLAAFVINPAMVGDPRRFVRQCRAAARASGWEPLFEQASTGPGSLPLARRAVGAGARLVVAAGGDGTVRACAQVLAGTGLPLAIVPLGTANLTARALGIPAREQAAIEVALRGTDRRIDLARAEGVSADGTGADGEGMWFAAMAGIGLDAAVVSGASDPAKRRLGWLAYAASGAAHLWLPPRDFTLRLDGGQPVSLPARCVVAGNAGLLPGGFTLLPDASLDDGLLDVGVLAPSGALGWPRVAALVLTRSRRQDRQLGRFQARRVEISAAADLPRQVDGELIAPGPTLAVSVRPAALTVRVV